MGQIRLYNVAPSVPTELKFLEELSYNMWWSWHPVATELFVRINPQIWNKVGANPRAFLTEVPQSRLEELAHDSTFLQQLHLVESEYRREIKPSSETLSRCKVAYFSLEFGIHESARLYSGGLGILAGDHLKAASDLDLPIVGVGLMYRQGYFKQYIDRNGWQTERYPENMLHKMPLIRAYDSENKPAFVTIPLMDRELKAAIWILNVGNIPLVLLDTELPENPPEFREITWRLYGGDKRMRIQQELLLGIGGYQALAKLGIEPACCHMNEGHAAFLSLARIAHIKNKYNYDADTAMEVVWRSNVFTTHTPVPAGNEVFDIALARPYLAPFCQAAGVDINRMINWGIAIQDRGATSEMSMTILGIRMANFNNGVSALHGEVARSMWKHLWPGRGLDEIPVGHITNGVHVPSWVSLNMRVIFQRYLRSGWLASQAQDVIESGVDTIPNEELWAAHEADRYSLVRQVRRRLQESLDYYQVGSNSRLKAKNILDPNVLTVGFARRFATYKRGNLLLRNKERLLALLRNTERPIQFVFAGKAHPADDCGKSIIQEIIKFSRENGVSDRFIMLENYDISLARYLVQGVDVWLNNPRRPQEASGTSGMKAAINGVPNCSILDGWWDEAWTPKCGWAIPTSENYNNLEDQDNYESQALFDILENDIIPCFYDRTDGEIPARWVNIMKHSIKMSLNTFSSRRMVADYNEMFYTKAVENYDALMLNNAAKASALKAHKISLVENFEKLWIEYPWLERELTGLHVGDSFKVTTKVYLHKLKPEEVDVEVYYGHVNAKNEIKQSYLQRMELSKDLGNGNYEYSCTINCSIAGSFGLTARITPVGNEWEHSVPGFMCWPR